MLFLLSSSLHKLSEGNSQNKGALQESFVIKLKTLKDEYEANTASLLSVINDLQQNMNTTQIKDLKHETQSMNKTIEEQQGTIKKQQSTINELTKTVEAHQLVIVQSYALVEVFNRTIIQQRSSIEQLQKTTQDQELRIDRLNETDVINLKEDVEVLESVMEDLRRSSKAWITLLNIINTT